jgi:hypothetical protein
MSLVYWLRLAVILLSCLAAMPVSLSCLTRLVGLADCYHADGCARKRLNDANDWLAIAQVQTQTAFPLKLPLTPKSPV